MEDLKKRALSYFSIQDENEISVNPKSDGRIEIPKLWVKQLGFDKLRVVSISFSDGEFIVHKCSNEYKDNEWEVRVTDGRVRVPSSVLKLSNLIGKQLFLRINSESITGKSYSIYDKVARFFDTLTENQLQLWCSIFCPDFEIEPNVSISEAQDEILDSVEQKAIDDIVGIEDENALRPIGPELILLDMAQPTVFKITGGPYTFPAIWLEKDKEIVRPYKGSSDRFIRQLYVIPGFQILKKVKRIGFLLVQEEVFEQIRNKVLEAKKDFPEIILWYDSFVHGNFKVYLNPSTDVDTNIIHLAQTMCNSPMKFIEKNFRVEEFDDVAPEKFPVLVIQNLKTYLTKEGE